MKHLFIDTNVLLRVFTKTSDTINEVETLIELIKARDLKLYTTDQVCDEYYRNVESEISLAIKSVEQIPDRFELPRIAQGFGDANQILQSFDTIRSFKKSLLEAVREAAAKGELRVDELVNKLFEEATTIEKTPELIEKARLRRDLGSPPGKKDSLGDQLNWECLLEGVGDHALHVISKDGDFAFKGDTNTVKRYLATEWETAKGASLHLHDDLKSFLKAKFPNAKNAVESKKHSALEKLEKSGNFIRTHSQIAILNEVFESIKKDEAIRIFQAFIDNTQIRWLAFDDDVKDFYTKLFERFYPDTPAKLDQELLEAAPYFQSEPPF